MELTKHVHITWALIRVKIVIKYFFGGEVPMDPLDPLSTGQLITSMLECWQENYLIFFNYTHIYFSFIDLILFFQCISKFILNQKG